MKIICSAALLLCIGGAPLFAQQPPQQPPGLLNPRAGPEHRRLAFLLGAWEEKVIYPGQAEKDGSGRWFTRPLLGMYLSFQYEGAGPQGNYRAFGVLAFDRDASGYRMMWFDDAGGIGDYRGHFTDDNTLSLEHRAKVEGRDFRERITYRRISATQVQTVIEQAWDNENYKTYLEASATRTGDAPPPGQQPLRRPNAPPDAPRP
jgi:hypothetical protein